MVFGGDMRQADPEFNTISERSAAAHVYVLDVADCSWTRVATTGTRPAWRSLHVGKT